MQGSGLGPLLFVIYVNELAEIIVDYNVGVKLFAGDLKMHCVSKNDTVLSCYNFDLQSADFHNYFLAGMLPRK